MDMQSKLAAAKRRDQEALEREGEHTERNRLSYPFGGEAGYIEWLKRNGMWRGENDG